MRQPETAVSIPDPFAEESEPIETATNRAEQPATFPLKMMMIVIAIIVIGLDQASKYLVEANLPLYQIWAPFPAIQKLFRITHVPNTGTAFGLFANGSLLFMVIAIIVAIVIIYYNFTLSTAQRTLRIALGLQLGGALGNLIDRFRLGHVTDFLDFGPWPIFNIADMSIVTGACVLGWMVWQDARREKAMAEAQLLVKDALRDSPMDSEDE